MLWWLVQNTVTAALLAGVVCALCRLGRFRPAVGHALWLVVLLKLLTPPVVVWPWALPAWLSQGTTAVYDSEPAFGADHGTAPTSTQLILARVEMSTDSRRAAPVSAAPVDGHDAQPSVTRLTAWLPSALASAWVAGALLMGLLQATRIVRYRKLLAGGKQAPRCLRKQVDELAGKLQVRSPQTRLVARIRSPFVWGLGRAKLFWPALLMSSLPAHCRRSVIAHELAHLRRRDHWVSWLETVAACAWWWNPLYWYVCRQLRLHAELACDAWVIGTLPEDRRVYAEALIEVTAHVSQTAAPLPVLGMDGSARQLFERRLTMIMHDRIPHRLPRAGLLAVGGLALLALPGWSQNGAAPQKTEPLPAREVKQDQLNRSYSADELGSGIEAVWVAELQNVIASNMPDAEREKRLQSLEKQIQSLLKEIQDLRKSAQQQQPLRQWISSAEPIKANAQQVKPYETTPLRSDVQWRVQVRPTVEFYERRLTARDAQHVVTLARTTYSLPHAKAEVLAAFLREHVKANVMETKVEGDSLTITTTPETQKALDGLMGLIQAKPTAAEEDRKSLGQALSETLDRDVKPSHPDPESQRKLELYYRQVRQAKEQLDREQTDRARSEKPKQ